MSQSQRCATINDEALTAVVLWHREGIRQQLLEGLSGNTLEMGTGAYSEATPMPRPYYCQVSSEKLFRSDWLTFSAPLCSPCGGRAC